MARVETASVGGAAIGGTDVLGVSLKSRDGVFYQVRQTALTDDTLSTVDNDKSAIAIANAINDSTEFHGVTAQSTAATQNLGAITGGNFSNAANMTINGEMITGISVQADDADGTLVDTINALTEKTGVVATIADDNGLVLTAEDGRNIEVVTVGAPAGVGAAGTQVYRGGLVMQADENIVIGQGDGSAVAGANQENTIFGMTLGVTTVGKNTDFSVDTIDVTDRAGANEAIDILDVALKQVAESRSGLGAVQNRMESTVRNLEVASENLSASRSRILDADFAQETAAFSRNQIMQQAGVSVLAQANQQPQIALALLS
jgi:flagellin